MSIKKLIRYLANLLGLLKKDDKQKKVPFNVGKDSTETESMSPKMVEAYQKGRNYQYLVDFRYFGYPIYTDQVIIECLLRGKNPQAFFLGVSKLLKTEQCESKTLPLVVEAMDMSLWWPHDKLVYMRPIQYDPTVAERVEHQEEIDLANKLGCKMLIVVEFPNGEWCHIDL